MTELPDRVPPHNIEMEMAAIGSMILESSAIEAVRELVHEGDFYRPAHNAVFASIVSLHERHEPVDMLTLQDDLRRREMLDSCGGPAYMLQLMNSTVTPSNAGYYAKVVSNKAMLRRFQSAAHAIMSAVHAGHEEVETVSAEVERVITEAMNRTTVNEPKTMKQLVSEAFNEIEDWERDKRHIRGIPSGLHDLDFLTRGFHPHEFIVIAARPAMGKSALAGQIAVNAARNGHRTLVATLEMKDRQLVHRMIATAANTDGSSIKSGYLSVEDWRSIGEACSELSELPIVMDDYSDTTLDRLKAICRREARRGLALVVVDYLQLVKTDQLSDGRTREVDVIAHGLKGIAKSLNIPVIALSQLSRKVDDRPNHTPILGDLRESGGIEAEADVVIFPYNPAFYGPPEDRTDFEPTQLIVAKARSGMVGVARAGWRRRVTEFVNIAKEYETPTPDLPKASTTRTDTIHRSGTAPTNVIDATEFFQGLPVSQEADA
jgi:replicative DNA helicase